MNVQLPPKETVAATLMVVSTICFASGCILGVQPAEDSESDTGVAQTGSDVEGDIASDIAETDAADSAVDGDAGDNDAGDVDGNDTVDGDTGPVTDSSVDADGADTRDAEDTSDAGECPVETEGPCDCDYNGRSKGVCSKGKPMPGGDDEDFICGKPDGYSEKENCDDELDNDCNGTVNDGCACNYRGNPDGVCGQAKIGKSGHCEEPDEYSASEKCGIGDRDTDNDCDGDLPRDDSDCAI